MHTIGFSLACHVGKTYCKKVMEHFVHCIIGFTSRCATRRVPVPSFLSVSYSLSNFLSQSVSVFPTLSAHCCSLLLSIFATVLLFFSLSLSGAVMSIHSKAQRFEVLPNGTLVIQNVQLQDRGTYICSAQSFLGRDRWGYWLPLWMLMNNIPFSYDKHKAQHF